MKHKKPRKSPVLLLPDPLRLFSATKAPKGQADMVSPQRPFSLFPLECVTKNVLKPSWNHCGDRKAL